ncbi:N-acetyltransferase family protein [Parasphingorhabdus sp.]|uniref:GNAT family N-acetyltransferase n=1 Tax=Parasphingorhabdus sp. TaxID=2709688 RepID=UPI003D274BC2
MAVIRPACVEDAGRCAQIYAPFVENSWVSFETEAPDASEMARRIAIARQTHDWLVAEQDGGIAGYAYGSSHRERRAYRQSCDVTVYVDPACARSGIGSALYAALFESLAKSGKHAVFAGVALPNAASLALHKALGFTSVGVYHEVGWKMGAWRDVQWLEKLL